MSAARALQRRARSVANAKFALHSRGLVDRLCAKSAHRA